MGARAVLKLYGGSVPHRDLAFPHRDLASTPSRLERPPSSFSKPHTERKLPGHLNEKVAGNDNESEIPAEISPFEHDTVVLYVKILFFVL